MTNSFNALDDLYIDGKKKYKGYNITALEKQYKVSRLPYSLKILLENLLRFEDGINITKADIEALCKWDPKAEASKEISFTPARTVLQDFTGVPCVVDFAAMRDAMQKLGGNPAQINPLSPAELVIDHSVMIDRTASSKAFDFNARIEFQRNVERYGFLRWGQEAFANFKVVPPDTGIVHQINLEYLARVVFEKDGVVYPDTLVGTDSHTTMINGLGVLGWGVGGIEAEAAMLGQPITMLIPQVVGFKLTGKLPEGATATDLVLTVTQTLRQHGVVGKFVEFFGDGLADLPLADRATLANMAPEYGATCGIFPIDGETIRYMELTGRSKTQCQLVEAYAKSQGMWREDGAKQADYSSVLKLDMGKVQPSLAGPKRPQDRILLKDMKKEVSKHMATFVEERQAKGSESSGSAVVGKGKKAYDLVDGAVIIAAITSCTNTSNPAVLIAAGLLAQNAIKKGLNVKPWVKTSFAPGSKVVTDYMKKAKLMDAMEALGFHIVAHGCTTCIGNSGPLDPAITKAIQDNDLIVTSVLSGNRNFEGRVHPESRMNFLASPPLCVAYAIAGNTNLNMAKEPLGSDKKGNPVYLKDIWPSQQDVQKTIAKNLNSRMFKKSYGTVFDGDKRWKKLKVPKGELYQWDSKSTYVQNPPYFDGMSMTVPGIAKIEGARALAVLGDSITTDHISPAGVIKEDTPGGQYLVSKGVSRTDFNSYGSRRGNHEVMMRGTFANIRLRNQMAPGTEGGWTRFQPSGEEMFIYDAAMQYQAAGTPLVILAGKEYGTGSSRDWAAKGTILLGVKTVIAESFERIHRSNLVGMGVLPLQFQSGGSAASLGLDGSEVYAVEGLQRGSKQVTVNAKTKAGKQVSFKARVRIDTPKEWDYYEHGGILQYVLRQLAAASGKASKAA